MNAVSPRASGTLPPMQRRHFLVSAAAGAALLARLAPRALAQGVVPQGTPPAAPPLDGGPPASVSADKLARISIMTFNFTPRLKLEGAPPNPNRVLEVFDIPQYYADTYGVHNVELQHSHFASTETSYLNDFRARIEKVKSRMTQINVEFNVMTVSAPDAVSRNQAVDLTIRWVDHAVTLNCPRIMINQGYLIPESKANATAALKRMGDYAKSKGVKISVETRVVSPPYTMGPNGTPVAPAPTPLAADGLPLSSTGGPPAWELVKEVVEASGTYSNVDIGNIQAPDIAALQKVIKGLFNSSSGNMHMKVSSNWDLGAVVRYVNNDLGYKGLYSIEVPPPQIRGVYDTILANI